LPKDFPLFIINNNLDSVTNKKPFRIKTISEFHQLNGLLKPEHPLISVVDYAMIRHSPENKEISRVLDFYSV
jgi:AraC family transcriptional activator of pobA